MGGIQRACLSAEIKVSLVLNSSQRTFRMKGLSSTIKIVLAMDKLLSVKVGPALVTSRRSSLAKFFMIQGSQRIMK